jgi:hypothetical protein
MKKKNKPRETKDIYKEIRHLGVIVERVDDNVKLVAEQYGDLKNTLDSHTKILDSHTKILELHTEILDSHTKTLDSHTEMIGKLAVDVEIIKSDIEFIKHALKKKIDVDEFAALERRVALLEKRR